jgi:hypothetical protein
MKTEGVSCLQVSAFQRRAFLFGDQLGSAFQLRATATPANLHVILQRLSIVLGMLSHQDDILPFSHTLLSMFGGWVASLDKDSEFTRNRHQRDVT